MGLDQEDAAGAAALKYRWRKGPVAGPGNRLTTLKRQRSGRAKFDLRQLGGLHAAEQEQQYVMARKATFLLHQVCGRAGSLTLSAYTLRLNTHSLVPRVEGR